MTDRASSNIGSIFVVVMISAIMVTFILPVMGGPTQEAPDEEIELSPEEEAEIEAAIDTTMRGALGIMLMLVGGLKVNRVAMKRLQNTRLTP